MPIASATHKTFSVTKMPARARAPYAISLALALLFSANTIFQPAAAGEAQSQTADIVVTIPLAAPESTEQEVASQYGVEPIEQRSSQVLEQRIIVYRVPAGRAAADVMRQIGADARVSSVQPNFQYLPPQVPTQDPIIASRQRDDALSGQAKHRTAATASKVVADRRHTTTAPRLAPTPDTVPRFPREATASLAPRSRVSALGNNLAWPTADEPFVGKPSSR